MPHGFCISWTPGLLWTYVVSDTLIVLAYYSIPFTLAYFIWRRKDLQFRWIFMMFGAFILACGTTHLLSILLLWKPLYLIDAGVKIVTAAISITSAISLVWIMPKALRIPSPAQLQAEIMERQAAQLSLQESQDKLEMQRQQLTSLIEANPDVIMLKDDAGRLLITNKSAKRYFKLEDIDWHGKTDLELGALRPEMRALHERCFRDDEATWGAGRLTVFEEKMMDAQEGLLEYEVRKAPIYNHDGERKGLVVIGRDITASKRAEQYMRIADTAFESQEGIVITDASNFILRVNKAFTRLTGYTPEEVIGRTPGVLKSGRHSREFYQAMWAKLKAEHFWQGEVWDRRKNGEIYPKWLTIAAVTAPDGEVTNYVGTFTDLSVHKEAEEAIHRLAFYDPLTDLPNRRLLHERLHLLLNKNARNQNYGAAMLVDLDNFKSINDTKGHEIGDRLLVEVANRLKSCVRQGDVVARLGGDEFVIMLENLSTNETQAATQAESVAEKILESINQPYLLGGHKLHSSPSIGISLFVSHEITTEEVLKRADTAMYQAKNSGRNSIRFFDPDMQALLESRMMLESDLRNALAENQFQLVYQIQVNNDAQAFGAEALLRWEHPERGMVSPAEFIPLAEESGLILPIGEWVLRTACAQIKAWESNPLTRHLHVAVNMSARQFRQPDFVEQICHALKESGADASRLKLELTESLIVENITDTTAKMQALKLIGIRFSMDDFGTGYSSLTYLKKLPLAQLKIDRSFVHDIATDQSDAIIAQTIIGMAKNLGLDVIAEGVETEEQRMCLERLGCFAYQGYLFGKPASPETVVAMLSQKAETDTRHKE